MATSKDSISLQLKHLIAELKIKKKAKEFLQEWEEKAIELNILITGRTGTGKTTLVNAIIGEKVDAVGDCLDSKTGEVSGYSIQIGDVHVNIWDSHGLQDWTQTDDKYRESLKENCHNIDLMIYCIRMSSNRPFFEDINVMIKLTKALNISLWKYSIFVLTFANEVVSMAENNSDSVDERNEYYFKTLHEWRTSLRMCLVSDLRLAPEFVEDMSIVPAGRIDKPELPDPESDTKTSYWLSELWLKALYKIKLDAQPAMIKINAHRMKTLPKEYKDKEVKTRKQLLDETPIIFAEKGAEKGLEKFGFFGKLCGVALGHSFGVAQSLALLLKIAIESNKISEEDFVSDE